MRAHWVTRVAAVGAAALALLAGGGRQAAAQVFTLDAADSGWYNNAGFHNPTNTNYVVGEAGGAEYRNFFVFDLPVFPLPVVSVELRLFNPSVPPGYISPDPREIYTLFDVSTPISTLVAGGGDLTSVFADLGSGVPYGAQVVSGADNGAVVTIPFNTAAVRNLQTAGGLFAVGGALTTLGREAPEYAFGFAPAGTRQLVVVLIPEPGTLTLYGTGALGLFGYGLRRRRPAAR